MAEGNCGGPSLLLGVTDKASVSQGVLNSCGDFLVGGFVDLFICLLGWGFFCFVFLPQQSFSSVLVLITKE